jgi:hypothetical protein
MGNQQSPRVLVAIGHTVLFSFGMRGRPVSFTCRPIPC